MTLVRTPEALKDARAALGLSADALARIVRVEDGREDTGSIKGAGRKLDSRDSER